ncbi:MAG: anaerobic glycerol-3-phosphate dehydrogenase subunit B [Desulfovibrio sp.]|uniref:anaerobic glycerol-3-phosphate dehydrogenase subunit GlpB n=1 Tax=Desulfovibrio sp. TaxID=885 RepID=UPI0025BF2965|nr:anaerobic glycerol-3-phosphate dehydrogenase subunit GlpB [Desulfovibrio sp.]MCI7569085.1 anaerobic glycerol-3-phosphate dehydrogenase subunit B [Desulfovibrio sp.]
MSRTTDILVVGSGMAGLMAAIVACSRGKRVTLLSRGCGSLSIGSGCVDVLGYANGRPVEGNPLDALDALPERHPYRLVGRDGVAQALALLRDVCARHGAPLESSAGGNRRVPTILGTLKPTWLTLPSGRGELLEKAGSALVVSVDGLKDSHPALATAQLRRYPHLAGISWHEAHLENPIPGAHRNLSPLDIARYVESPEGVSWLTAGLRKALRAAPADVVLLPPVCGLGDAAWQAVSAAVPVPLIEMPTLPPGVGGLRLYTALKDELREHDVDMVENARITGADCDGRRCAALVAETACGLRRFAARAFVMATGGFMGGGFLSSPGEAREAVFGLPVLQADGAPLPRRPEDWSDRDIFGNHAFASAGVMVDAAMSPLRLDGMPALDNVFFAGRSVGGYDFASEKSGNGVAVATAWRAALSACAQC